MKEKLLKINKKVYALTISLFIAILGTLSVMLGIYSQKINTFELYLNEKTINNIVIENIYIGDSEVSKAEYASKKLKYKKEKLIYPSQNTGRIIKLNTSAINNVKVVFSNKTDYKYNIIVKKNGKKYGTIKVTPEKKVYSFEESNSTLSIIKSLVTSMTLKSGLLYLVILCSFLVISYFSIAYIFKFMKELKDDKFSLKKYILSICLLFILNLMYIYLLMQFIGWLALIIPFTFLFIILYYLRNMIIDKIWYSFAIIGMFMGVIFVLVFPPLHVPDEPTHFIKAYQQSYVFQYNWETEDEIGKKGYAYLPKNVESFVKKYGLQTTELSYHMYQPRTYFYDLFNITDYSDHSKETVWYAKFSSPIPYLPGSIMSIVARITSMPVMMFYLLGKLLNLIITLIMCYTAIKITPKFKKVFFIVCLLPMFFQQGAGYNMDWLTNCTFILLAAIMFKEIYGHGKIEKNSIINIIILFVILGLCKFGYFAIAFLLLLIPQKRFKEPNNLKRIVKLLLIISIPFILSVGINWYLRGMGYVENDPVMRDCITISTLYQDPVRIFSMVIETFKIRLDLDFIRGMINGFGSSIIWANDLVLFLSMFILTLTIICSDKNNVRLNKKEFIIISISFGIICALIYASMLFGWTTKDWNSIDGLQPRYFIPPALLLYILLQSSFVNIKTKNPNLLYSCSMTLLSLLSLITIIGGFYV